MKMQPPERARGVSEKPQEVPSVERGIRRRLGWSHLRAQAEQRPGAEARRQRWPVLLRAWGGTGGPRNQEADEISVAQRKAQGGKTGHKENCFQTLILLSLIQVTTGPE